MADLDLVVLGDAKLDLILTGADEVAFGTGERVIEGAKLTLGGSGAICACGAAALGLRVAFVGVVGDDEHGSFVASSLAARGVDTSRLRTDPELPTGISVVLKRGDEEAVLTSLGTVATFSAADVDPKVLAGARHVHVASYFLQEALRSSVGDLFARAHAGGASTSIDPNRDHTGDWDGGLFGLLRATDVLFANSSEVREITGVDDVDVAAEALAERGTVVAVKFLQGGGLAIWGDEVVRSEVIPTTVVDTTGAGASFAAGFIAGRLEGWSLDRCLALAVACASLSTRGMGGTTSQPTMTEALAALEATA